MNRIAPLFAHSSQLFALILHLYFRKEMPLSRKSISGFNIMSFLHLQRVHTNIYSHLLNVDRVYFFVISRHSIHLKRQMEYMCRNVECNERLKFVTNKSSKWKRVKQLSKRFSVLLLLLCSCIFLALTIQIYFMIMMVYFFNYSEKSQTIK